jgi:uncharacterized protein (UPF0212 family)
MWHGIVEKEDAEQSIRNGSISLKNRGLGKKTFLELCDFLGIDCGFEMCPCCGQVIKKK